MSSVVGLQGRSGTRFDEVVSDDLYNACWRYCCCLTANHHSAEDLLQEALVRSYLKLGQLKDLDRAKGWLFSIVRTTYIDLQRHASARPQASSIDTANEPVAENPPQAAFVDAALARLPGNQRELIELFHLEDLTLEETAQTLGIRVNTLKQRLLRARAALKRELATSFTAGELEELF